MPHVPRRANVRQSATTPGWISAIGPVSEMLFHLMFNRLPTMNVQLVRGREDIFSGFAVGVEAVRKLPGPAVSVCTGDRAGSPASLSGSFGFYRAGDTITAQNQERAKTPLTRPVLATGGAEGAAEGVAGAMGLAAAPVPGLVIPGRGHFVPDEAPEELLAALIPFPARARSGRPWQLAGIVDDRRQRSLVTGVSTRS